MEAVRKGERYSKKCYGDMWYPTATAESTGIVIDGKIVAAEVFIPLLAKLGYQVKRKKHDEQAK